MAKARLAAALAATLLIASPAFAETLDNNEVVQLAHAGLGAGAIIAKIHASDTRFDVSADALVALKRADVPDAVIAAMVVSEAGGGVPGGLPAPTSSADPSQPHAPGVYLLQDGPEPQLQQLDPTLADDTKTSNVLGWFFSYGLTRLRVTTILDGPTARLHAATPRPTFYFYFNQPGSGLYRNGLGTMRLDGPQASPAEFQLLRFDVVGGQRQAQTLSVGGALSRPDGPVSLAAFSSEEVSPGVFRVTPDADLPPGEYAFTVTPADDGDDAQARYFDFSVSDGD